jgi:hypothetical protein
MNTAKIVGATLVIFVAGILTGAILIRTGERGSRPWLRPGREAATPPQTNRFAPHPPGGRPVPPNPGNPGDPANPAGNRDREFLPQLERAMILAPEQRREIARIVMEGQERIRKLRQGIEPEIRREMQATHEQIQKLLTPEQQEQFRQLMRQRLRRDESAPPEAGRPRELREPRSPQPKREGDPGYPPPAGVRPSNPPPPEP